MRFAALALAALVSAAAKPSPPATTPPATNAPASNAPAATTPAANAPATTPPATPAPGSGAARGTPLSGAQLDARTNDIGALLRCPVCQGLSVTDSPATMARNMKAEIRQKLAAGYDQEQILAYFEQSYGEFVRLEPPMQGVNLLVWFGPLGVLLAGGAVIAWAMKRSPRPAGEPKAPVTASTAPAASAAPGVASNAPLSSGATGVASTAPAASAGPGIVAASSSVSDLPARDTLPADPRLAAAVRRVRALAYGWPEGLAPRERS